MRDTLINLSNDLAAAVETAGRFVVSIDARPRAASSGIHWRRGLIVTAMHTIRRQEEIRVTLPNGKRIAAELAGRDAGTDLALLKADTGDLPVAETDSAQPLKPGQIVLAVGRSPETGVNAALGVLSAVAGPWQTWRGGHLDQFVRLDLDLHPGGSGGAVVDASGKVIGLATVALTRASVVAIPTATVDRVVEALLTKGHVSRGYLGVGLQPVKLPGASGLIVLSVEPQSPAGEAGVLIGDILLGLDGKPVEDTDDVQAVLGSDWVGRGVKASFLRGGQPVQLSITIGERPRKCE